MTEPRRRVVLIGREGQMARALYRALQDAEYEIVQLARPDFDLTQPASLAQAIVEANADIVVNPAAYTAVDKAEDDPQQADAINAVAAGAISEAAARAGLPIIHLSTDYVFDGRQRTPYSEADATAPLSVYGRSKLEGERRVADANPRHVILRTSWLSSPYGSNFVKTMLRLGDVGTPLRVVDDQYGSPTFATDLADVIRQLVPRVTGATVPENSYGVFHATNAGQTTWCGFARAIMAGARARGGRGADVVAISTAEYPLKAQRPAYSVLSTRKLREVHGLELRGWEQGLSDCLDELIGPARRFGDEE